jgi:hypothetical protein
MLFKQLIMNKKNIFCAFWLAGQSFLLFGQQKITFKTGLLSPLKQADTHLFLAGDFNGWNPADKAWELVPESTGKYQLLKDLPKGIYHFKITRGNWQTVECTNTGKPIDNRVVTIENDTTIVMDIENWQDNFAPEPKCRSWEGNAGFGSTCRPIIHLQKRDSL